VKNLRPGRIYNLAKKYGNVPESRLRKIIAPQMQRAGQRILGYEEFYFSPPKNYYCTKPNLLNNENKEKPNSDGDDSETISNFGDEEEDVKIITQYDWIKGRRKLRNDLNQIDLDPLYLKRKKDLNEVEKRVLYKMLYLDKEIQTDTIVRNKLFLY
jgi:hypothetical protein